MSVSVCVYVCEVLAYKPRHTMTPNLILEKVDPVGKFRLPTRWLLDQFSATSTKNNGNSKRASSTVASTESGN